MVRTEESETTRPEAEAVMEGSGWIMEALGAEEVNGGRRGAEAGEGGDREAEGGTGALRRDRGSEVEDGGPEEGDGSDRGAEEGGAWK